ncbi:hypothetical protein [Streptomyces iconiensis]|uniref:Transposase n=1 Tax=Streptomyces iconiensis TaxID=1384038 RepID=A0ABT7A3S8_9ACTN|nr:hypothetical protein [Streptomyces iconiensis]MDJ1135717.1 hypothetical protein [Streptomyces iconiensis]
MLSSVGVARGVRGGWCGGPDAAAARAAKEYPSALRAAAGPVRYTLLSTLCHVRQTEITDSLVELFIQLVQKINTRADKSSHRLAAWGAPVVTRAQVPVITEV